ncbi:homoserine/homoserine lactone efflux protein [Janthinobacterium sp. CG_23.3]|uniref:LysE family translocator n=1 Tax=unclassified Janthinobacterium TaxID=2610881 RepID=UPI000345C67C|nr:MULTISPECIES: LysE family translocator [unclassified Janthinobacterium]MEC5161823.1 homoserine/homoserine lactone efflux protein [Janthinobacterium sp. CG_S6]
MNMKLYALFLIMATMTILSPGPGVIMTLTNSLREGFRGTVSGIMGLAFGIVIVAGISATGLGLVLATSALAFTVIKFIGAGYLVYLGVRLWRAPPFQFHELAPREVSMRRRFAEGLSLQVTNPKSIFFFLSVFPQFIDPSAAYGTQFSFLVLTFSALLIGIHFMYAFFASKAKTWLTSEKGGLVVNKVGGGTLVFFGVMLATAKR